MPLLKIKSQKQERALPEKVYNDTCVGKNFTWTKQKKLLNEI